MNDATARVPKLGALYFGIVFVFLFFPLLIIAPISFGDDAFMRFPPHAWSLRWYREFFGSSQWIGATTLSFRVALATSVAATLAGTMVAVAIERRWLPLKRGIRGLVSAPLVVPNIFLAVGLFTVAARIGWAGSASMLVCAHTVLALPFVVLMIGAPLRQLDVNLERAARIMGAGPLRAFSTAALPSLLPALFASAIFAFFVSFDELVVAEFLMGGRETLPMRIWADLKLQLNPTISAVSTLLVAVTVLALALVEWLRRRAPHAALSPH